MAFASPLLFSPSRTSRASPSSQNHPSCCSLTHTHLMSNSFQNHCQGHDACLHVRACSSPTWCEGSPTTMSLQNDLTSTKSPAFSLAQWNGHHSRMATAWSRLCVPYSAWLTIFSLARSSFLRVYPAVRLSFHQQNHSSANLALRLGFGPMVISL